MILFVGLHQFAALRLDGLFSTSLYTKNRTLIKQKILYFDKYILPLHKLSCCKYRDYLP